MGLSIVSIFGGYGCIAGYPDGTFRGLFGRYGYSINPQQAGADLFAGASNNIQTWMAGVGIADLIVPGSMLSVAAGQPFITPTDGTLEQTNYEAMYRVLINDNITISSGVRVITDPLNVN